jgi:hypothetical protein
MSDNQYDDSDQEASEARDRINRILRGGASGDADLPASMDSEDPLGDSEALARARAKLRPSRANLPAEQEPVLRSRVSTGLAPTRSRQALMVIGGVVAAGVLLVIVLLLAAPLLRGEGINLPFIATATPTSTTTPTPTATATETLTPTPTKAAPSTLSLPNLTCIYQSGTGCFDYCADTANAGECQSAREFISAQGANPEVWFQCVSPGTGPNVGNPLECLRDAWRATNP